MTTRAQITKAIEKLTGYADVQVAGSAADGCYHFYHDDNTDLNDLLSCAETTTVYVCYLNDLTPRQWADEFQYMIKQVEERLAENDGYTGNFIRGVTDDLEDELENEY